MSFASVKHIIETPITFLQSAWQRMRTMYSDHPSLKKWQQLSLDEQVMVSQAIIAEYLSQSAWSRGGDQIKVMWAGCYVRDYPTMASAIAFAEALALRESNLPVFLLDTRVKAGWHGTVTVNVGQDEID